jgi:hypothetical protein
MNQSFTEKEIAVALTYSQLSPFYCRSHYVIPNVSWGMGFNHELDLLSINPDTRFGTEIEIKVSKADLKKDLEKRHAHKDCKIKYLYFAGPESLKDTMFEFVPKDAGIITVFKDQYKTKRYQCTIRRMPKRTKGGYTFSDKELMQLLRLGTMRYWMLQKKNIFKGIDNAEKRNF